MTLAEILIDAATAAQRPTPFVVNSQLRDAGVSGIRVLEFTDRQLHVIDTRASRVVLSLNAYAERML